MLTGIQIKRGMDKFKERITVNDMVGIFIGAFITVIGIQCVLAPVKVLTGGLTGIAMVLRFVTGIPIWTWLILLNIPIFIAGYKFVSRRFVFYSLFAILVQSLFIGIMEPLSLKLDNLLLAAILGGILNGLGTGIILRYKGSTGGIDIIAVIIKRLWGYGLGQTYFLGNLLVLILSLLTSNIETMLFSAISIYVCSKAIDSVESGPNVARTAMIVSEKTEAIADEIINGLNRSCTYLSGKGAYTGEEKSMILVTVGKTQLPRLKEIVFEIDPKAFMMVNETIEVLGKGFKASTAEF